MLKSRKTNPDKISFKRIVVMLILCSLSMASHGEIHIPEVKIDSELEDAIETEVLPAMYQGDEIAIVQFKPHYEWINYSGFMVLIEFWNICIYPDKIEWDEYAGYFVVGETLFLVAKTKGVWENITITDGPGLNLNYMVDLSKLSRSEPGDTFVLFRESNGRYKSINGNM